MRSQSSLSRQNDANYYIEAMEDDLPATTKYESPVLINGGERDLLRDDVEEYERKETERERGLNYMIKSNLTSWEK